MKQFIFWVVFLSPVLNSSAATKTIIPRQISSETSVDLSHDIIIDTKVTPIEALPSFGSVRPEKVIITSSSKNSIVIKSKGIWDLRSFNSKNKVIEFRGNAQLVCEPGAKILFNNGVLRFSDSSRWIIE